MYTASPYVKENMTLVFDPHIYWISIDFQILYLQTSR